MLRSDVRFRDLHMNVLMAHLCTITLRLGCHTETNSHDDDDPDHNRHSRICGCIAETPLTILRSNWQL